MRNLMKFLFGALVLTGLIFVSPATPVQAGGCLYPELVATGAYYVYSVEEAPNDYVVCEQNNPGSVPGYFNIDSPFDACLSLEQAATGEYRVYTQQEEPELYALCNLFNPETFPGYQVKSVFERVR